MSRYEFETLMRYVDGELDDHVCAEIEAWLPSDPAARALIADLRAQRVELERHFADMPAVEPGWSTLVTIDRAFAERRRQRHRPVLITRWALPLAASLLIACISGMAGYIVAVQQINPAIDNVIAAYARDDAHIAQALAGALENHTSGNVALWTNPDSGTTGSITPLRTFQSTDGQWCREFEREVRSKTGDTQTTGIACRNADGQWRLVHERPREI